MKLLNNLKISNTKIIDENWVLKVLKKRIMKPVYISAIIVIIIIFDSVINAYLDSKEIFNKNERIQLQIDNKKARIKNINKQIKNIKKDIEYINGTSLDSKGAITLMTRVCQLLKSKEVIGSFYIKKRNNSNFNNVLNFEIQISYGDKDLLFIVSKLMLEKVFYLKNIEKTRKGLKFELFKPSSEVNNGK